VSGSSYTTKELSAETWKDFERLFSKHGGVQAGCWCMFYHRARPISAKDEERVNPLGSAPLDLARGRRDRPLGSAPLDLARGRRASRNRRDKKALVRSGESHGILVYSGDQPVGWCQFGPQEELPRIDAGRNYRKLKLAADGGRWWRITCFFVDRDFRRRGVADLALQAALDAIRERGGGIVEAYPVTNKRAVPIWFGTVRMFERKQFQKIADLGRSNIVMRRRV